jgi:pimeloyl-ACP methyl ester carboxylesterase
VDRLCGSGATSIVVFGDRSEVGLADDERRGLDACANATLVDVIDSGHMLMADQPARTAELILELYALQTAR